MLYQSGQYSVYFAEDHPARIVIRRQTELNVFGFHVPLNEVAGIANAMNSFVEQYAEILRSKLDIRPGEVVTLSSAEAKFLLSTLGAPLK